MISAKIDRNDGLHCRMVINPPPNLDGNKLRVLWPQLASAPSSWTKGAAVCCRLPTVPDNA